MPATPFVGLEALEPRALCAANPLHGQLALPATAVAAVQAQAASPLTISDRSVRIDAALAAQIAKALDAGRDVTVEATEGSIHLDAPILVSRGRASLTFTAAERIELASDLRAGGPVLLAASVILQQPGRSLHSGGDLEVVALADYDSATDSPETLILRGVLRADGKVTLNTPGNMTVQTIRSRAKAPVSPDSDPFLATEEAAIRLINSGFLGSIRVLGLLTAESGSIAISSAELVLDGGARVAANRGHLVYLGEALDTAPGSVMQAERGDIAIFGQLASNTLRGELRAVGDSRADVLIAARPAFNFRIDRTASLVTEGGNVQIEAGLVEVLGLLDTGGGDLVTDTDTFKLVVGGIARIGGLVTPDSGGTPGGLELAIEGGSLTVLGQVATRGGSLTVQLDNGVRLDPQAFFDRKLDRTRPSQLTLGPRASFDTRSSSGVGGDIQIALAHSSFTMQPGSSLRSGGGQVRIAAEGGYVSYRVDPDGQGPRGEEQRTEFFGALVQLDGVIHTVGPDGGGALQLPTAGATLRLGAADRSKFLAAAGNGQVLLTASAVGDAGRPARGGQVTLARLIAGGTIRFETPLLRLAGRSTLISTADDVAIGSGILGVPGGKARTLGVGGASLNVRSAKDIRIGGDVRQVRDLKLAAAKTIDLSRPAAASSVTKLTTVSDRSGTVRLEASRVLRLDADALLVRDRGLTVQAPEASRLKIRRPLNLLVAGDIRIQAPDATLGAGNLVTAGSVEVQVKRLALVGDVYANGGIRLDAQRIAGDGFTASTFAGKVTVNAPPASARKVQTARLPAAIDPGTFAMPVPVFSFPNGTVTL